MRSSRRKFIGVLTSEDISSSPTGVTKVQQDTAHWTGNVCFTEFSDKIRVPMNCNENPLSMFH